MTLDPACADHLHHQVHRELAIEPREERVSREVDLMLVESRIRGVPLLVGDRCRRVSKKRLERVQRRIVGRPTVRSAARSSSASRTS